MDDAAAKTDRADRADRQKAAATRGSTRGFSLVELAIAMFIFALILSNILTPAAELYERRKNNTAREYLDRASQAVIDYALRNRTAYREITYGDGAAFIPAGRPYLPCPDVTGDGVEDRHAINPAIPITISAAYDGGSCQSDKGTIPWRTLQLQPLSDPWDNYLTYHADASYSNALLGFDETTRADRHDITRTLNGTTYRTRMPQSLPFVVCRRPGNVAACTFGDDHIIAGVVTTTNLTVGARSFTGGTFLNGIVEGVAFLVMSHGANGRYARSYANEACRGGGPANVSDLTADVPGSHEYRNGYRACSNTSTDTLDRGQNFYFSYPITDHPETGEFDDILRWTMAEELMGALNDAGVTRENEAEARSPLPIVKLPFLAQ